MPDSNIIDICKGLIEKNAIDLSLFTAEFKNTITNTFYKEVKIFLGDSRADLNEEVTMDKFQSEKIGLLKRMVKSLKEIQEKEGKKEVKFINELILDEMKYDIKDAHKFSEINRRVKRFFRKSKVDEIDDLYKSFE
jgi:protein-disulfide isomerase